MPVCPSVRSSAQHKSLTLKSPSTTTRELSAIPTGVIIVNYYRDSLTGHYNILATIDVKNVLEKIKNVKKRKKNVDEIKNV